MELGLKPRKPAPGTAVILLKMPGDSRSDVDEVRELEEGISLTPSSSMIFPRLTCG